MGIGSKLRHQSLAIVSLLVALGALGYNTWRNEQTEDNRNVRAAGFEMLIHIGRLQQLVYVAQYDPGKAGDSLLSGSAEALVLRDLARLMPAGEQMRAEALYDTWTAQWRALGNDDEQAAAAIDGAINDLRSDVTAILSSLD
jgi:hypothetical protein